MFSSLSKWVVIAVVALMVLASQITTAMIVAYQSNVEPAKFAQATGVYDRVIGEKIQWRLFNSGAEVLSALASGSVDVALIGSSPLGAAVANQLPIEVFLVATDLKSAEALVVHQNSGIRTAPDLIGKRIATPFASTAHYSLLSALKHWKIPSNQVRLINLKPAEIHAAWRRGDLDAAFVWSPALANIKKTGHVLTDAAQVGQWGAPSFEVWVTRRDFAQKHPEKLRQFANVTLDAYADYKNNPAQWRAGSPKLKYIAQITGVDVDDVPALLRGAFYPDRTAQLSQQYLAQGTLKGMEKSVEFLKELGMVRQVSPNYQQFITPRFVRPQP